MQNYNLTNAQKELLNKLVEYVQTQRLREDILVTYTVNGYRIFAKDDVIEVSLNDLNALAEERLISLTQVPSKKNNKSYNASITQYGNDAVQNSFAPAPSSNVAKVPKNNHNLKTPRNPWISGSFYLATVVIIGALLLVIAKNISIVVFPFVVIGALLLVSVVGALQLRQDEALSQKNFLSLMMMVFKQVPFLRKKNELDKSEQSTQK